MTEDEHIAATEATEEFCRDLASAAAKALRPFRPEVRREVMYMLQDSTSLYSPYTHDRITQELKWAPNVGPTNSP